MAEGTAVLIWRFGPLRSIAKFNEDLLGHLIAAPPGGGPAPLFPASDMIRARTLVAELAEKMKLQ
jgi:hypothetical protein